MQPVARVLLQVTVKIIDITNVKEECVTENPKSGANILERICSNIEHLTCNWVRNSEISFLFFQYLAFFY